MMTVLVFLFLLASIAFYLVAFGMACFVLAYVLRSNRIARATMTAGASKPPQRVREPPRFQPPVAPIEARAPVTPRQARVTIVPVDVFDTMSLPPTVIPTHEVDDSDAQPDSEAPVHKPSS